jgi:DivIVA domain-containing protein
VTTALLYLVLMALVAAVVFLLVSVVFGRGEQLPPLPPGASPTRLPESGVTGADLFRVRFQLVLRGYKMSEVDWVLRRTGAELDELRARVAELEAERDAPATEPVAPPEPAAPRSGDGWVTP